MTEPNVFDDEVIREAVAALGLDDVPEEQKLAALDALAENVLSRVVIAVTEKLPSHLRTEYQSHIGGGRTASLIIFLQKHVPDFPELVARETNEEIAETKKLLADAA